MQPQPSPIGTFFRFVLGFLLFISASFILTYAVNSYAHARDLSEQAAAARALMLSN